MWLVFACASDPTAPPRDASPTSPEPSSPPPAPAPTTPSPTDTGPPPTDTTPPALETYRGTGPFAVTESSGEATSPSCRMGYARFTPDGGGPLIVVAHGFQGSRSWMVGWGEHLASWGLDVVVPDLCHATVFDTDHEQNGLDLVALAGEVAPGAPAQYVGHSAGGLAAFVAAANDATTVAHLGLDTVEAFGVGEAAAPSMGPLPIGLVAAEPSTCNTQGNALLLYAEVGAQGVRISDADHCDFPSPANGLCGLACSEGADQAWIEPALRTLVTSWALWRAGLDPAAATWWTEGEPGWDSLVGPGWVVPLGS